MGLMDEPIWMWAIFLAVVLVLLILDLGVLHRKSKEISIRESLKMTVFYIIIGLSFGAFVWIELGDVRGKYYLTGYIVEKTLSMDNLFVMSLIFSHLAIPKEFQYRVLFWGILGVILLRGIMIGLGAAIVSNFAWVLMIFAAFLIFTGIKMLMMADDDEMDVSENKLLKWLRAHLPITEELHGKKFSVWMPHPEDPKKKVRYYTPLFLALVLIEIVDLIFALDSIPAIFAITTDAYVVYTSNVFAILGLRAMYFALNEVIDRFHYVKYSLSLVLIFIGGKVYVADFLNLEKIPASISLGVTFALLGGGIVYSLYKTKGVAKT